MEWIDPGYADVMKALRRAQQARQDSGEDDARPVCGASSSLPRPTAAETRGTAVPGGGAAVSAPVACHPVQAAGALCCAGA